LYYPHSPTNDNAVLMDPTTTTEQPPLWNRATIVTLLSILVVALGLRAPQIRESLWLDELHTAWCVSGSWGEVAPRAVVGNHSPVYFWIVRFVVGIFGASELTLRLPSLLAGLSLVAVVGIATGKLTGSRVAASFAAVLVALDCNCIFYSQEARPYAILQLVAWSHALLVWNLVQNPTVVRRTLFIAGALLQLYLHYTSVLFVAAEVVFLMEALSKRNERSSYRWRHLTMDLAVITLAALPAAWHLIEIGTRRQQWAHFVLIPTVKSYFRVLQLDVYLFPMVALVAGLFIVRSLLKTRVGETKEWPQRLAVSLLACLLLIPSVLAWVATRQHLAALFFGRYLTPTLVAPPVCSALLARFVPSGWLRGIVAVLTAAAAIWTSGMWQNWQREGRVNVDRRQDWRSAVAFVNQEATTPDSICYVRSGFLEADQLRAPHDSFLEEYCLAPVNSLYRLRIKAIPLPMSPPFDLGPETDRAGNCWIIFNGSSTTRERFLAEIENRFAVRQKQSFGDVLVCEVSP
jgi:mannosyltransferase